MYRFRRCFAKTFQLQGGEAPLTPHQGLCLWTPLGALPPDLIIGSRSMNSPYVPTPVTTTFWCKVAPPCLHAALQHHTRTSNRCQSHQMLQRLRLQRALQTIQLLFYWKCDFVRGIGMFKSYTRPGYMGKNTLFLIHYKFILISQLNLSVWHSWKFIVSLFSELTGSPEKQDTWLF